MSTRQTTDVVQFGPDLPTDADLRLCGDMRNKRVLDLGCGRGENAVTFAKQGAHVIAVDHDGDALADGRALADHHEVRVEWHHSDVADLAFLRADSIDLTLAAGLLTEVDDVDRLLRQVHRVLRAGSAFVFSYEHPMAMSVSRDDVAPGGLPLGRLEVRRSYFEPGPIHVTRAGEERTLFPAPRARCSRRCTAPATASTHCSSRNPCAPPTPDPRVPTAIIWRARKEGV